MPTTHVNALAQHAALCGRALVFALLPTVVLSAAASRSQPAGLPDDIQAAIRKQYASPDMQPRYLDGAVDLNADGKAEIIVHVVGGGACGTGGCPTLVFTPAAAGYRLVSTITVSSPPIRASATSTQGWRNLIVHVGGGGTRSQDVELTFDGKSYPRNPTVASARVKPAAAGGDVVIKEFKSFEDTKPLPAGGAAAAPQAPAAATAKPAGGSGPSFDCSKATTPVEKTICGDAALAQLDRTLADAYAKAMADWPDDFKTQQRTVQRNWMASRNACAKQSDTRACVEKSYRQRLVEVQIQSGQIMVPSAVGFVCKGREKESFTAVFYNNTDPRSVVVTLGDRQAIAFAVPTGSGARYQGNGVDFWEHQGEATVTWSGATFTCRPR